MHSEIQDIHRGCNKYNLEPINAEHLHKNNFQGRFQALPSFGNNLSEDPHSVVIAHVLKVHIIYLASRQKKRNIYYHIRQIHTIFFIAGPHSKV